jgi:GNAT superfamily N-acetyltransferase
MAIKVTAGDLARDRARIIEAIGKWLTPQSNDLRYDWLYLNSSDGPARVWLAENLAEDDDRRLVGLGSAFPRKIQCGRSMLQGCVFGDFGVAPEYRSAGLAIQLQRACFESLESGWADVAYDFPSTSMMAIYNRLSRGKAVPFVRTAKPLRADQKIKAKIPVRAVAKAAAGVANTVLTLKDRATAVRGEWTISSHQGRCGAEFTHLATQAAADSACRIFRSADYLNWRYLDHPTTKFEILTARRNQELAAYLVLARDQKTEARVVDLFGIREDTLYEALLSHAVELLRADSVDTINAPVIPHTPQHTALKKMGFKDREPAHLMLFETAGTSKSQSYQWQFMDGDRDS